MQQVYQSQPDVPIWRRAGRARMFLGPYWATFILSGIVTTYAGVRLSLGYKSLI